MRVEEDGELKEGATKGGEQGCMIPDYPVLTYSIGLHSLLPVQVRYLIHRRVDTADIALVIPTVMPAALQLAVVVTVTAAAVQEELIDAPVLDLLTVGYT